MLDKKERLIIIDGNALVHRAYHALPPLSTKEGELVNAVYGFLLVFFKAVKDFQPEYIVATFDVPKPTFRHEKFKEYKANRPPTPKDLSSQISRIKEILKEFKVPIVEKEGVEADDVIGSISRYFSKPKTETIILSGDLDVLQLVDSYAKAYVLRRGVKDAVLYDIAGVKQKYEGLVPEQLPDFKGLRGDPSDNIPGVPGIGEKTAIKLIKEFGSLENLYRAIEEPLDSINQKLLEKLKENKDQAFLSKMLAEIKIDIPFSLSLEDCRWGRYDREEAAKSLENLGFFSLIPRLP